MAIQLAHEIRAVPGIDFIPLPVEFQRTFVFSAGLAPNAQESAPARQRHCCSSFRDERA